MHAARGQVHLHARARMEDALAAHRRFIQGKRAGLGGQIEPVVRDGPARGPETVAIEPRSHSAAIGVDQESGAVPGLHGPAPEGVEGGFGLGGRQHDGEDVLHMRDAAAVEQGLGDLVQAAGIADGAVRHQLVGLEPDGHLAGDGAGAVAGDGVDLAVVGEEAEGLGLVPGGAGVRAEAAVDEGEAGDEARVQEIRIEAVEIRRAGEGLVDDGPGGQRGEEELVRDALLLQLGAQHLLGVVEQLVEGSVRAAVGRPAQDGLPQGGQGAPGIVAQHRGIGGDLAVGQHIQVEEREGGLEQREGAAQAAGILGHEEAGHGDLTGPVAQQLEGDVGHDARAVAADLIGRAAAPVLHAPQGLEGIPEDLVAGLPGSGGDESHPACGVFVPRCVGHRMSSGESQVTAVGGPPEPLPCLWGRLGTLMGDWISDEHPRPQIPPPPAIRPCGTGR